MAAQGSAIFQPHYIENVTMNVSREWSECAYGCRELVYKEPADGRAYSAIDFIRARVHNGDL